MADREKGKVSLVEVFALSRRAAKVLRGYCPQLFISGGLYAAVSAIVPYATVFLSARIIEELASGRRAQILWRWVIAAVTVEAVLAVAKAGLEHWKNASRELAFMARQRIIRDKLLDLDYADMDRQATHDKVAQIQQNEGWSNYGLPVVAWQFEGLVRSVVGIISAVALTAGLFLSKVPPDAGRLAVLDSPAGYLLLLAAVAVPLIAAPMLSGISGRLYYGAAEEAAFGNRVFAAAYELVEERRMPDIRMYNQQTLARKCMESNPVFGTKGPFARITMGLPGVLDGVASGMSGVLTGIVYMYVCLKAWAGAFGVGAVTQYVAAVTALTRNVQDLLDQVTQMRINAPFLKTVFEFLDMPNAMYQGSLTTEKRSDREYDVEFRDVSFKYPGSDGWALRHVSVKFRVGKRLAVVGENGSGKTTFIKLLCRLYDPQEGQILLNGIDIRKYNYRDYMDVFSVVFQDFQLLSQPLGANVAGRSDYDRERVLKSLADAGLGEWIKKQPGGLNTMLYREFDEEGVMISGGEAQKIAIARALYKDAPFIILDEPTAALDPIAEAEIYAQFNEISGDKTAVYISHRLSSCRFCDEILVFDAGRIVQQGEHDALLEDETGKYHQLWHAQAQYYRQ